MSDEHWAEHDGLDDPLSVEVEPGVHKSSHECSTDELAAAGISRLMQARTLMDESTRLLALAEQRRRQNDT